MPRLVSVVFRGGPLDGATALIDESFVSLGRWLWMESENDGRPRMYYRIAERETDGYAVADYVRSERGE